MHFKCAALYRADVLASSSDNSTHLFHISVINNHQLLTPKSNLIIDPFCTNESFCTIDSFYTNSLFIHLTLSHLTLTLFIRTFNSLYSLFIHFKYISIKSINQSRPAYIAPCRSLKPLLGRVTVLVRNVNHRLISLFSLWCHNVVHNMLKTVCNEHLIHTNCANFTYPRVPPPPPPIYNKIESSILVFVRLTWSDVCVCVKVKVLYVRNLKASVTEEQLKEAFEPYGKVERTKRVKSYGFVHFVEREAAIKAMEALNGTVRHMTAIYSLVQKDWTSCVNM